MKGDRAVLGFFRVVASDLPYASGEASGQFPPHAYSVWKILTQTELGVNA